MRFFVGCSFACMLLVTIVDVGKAQTVLPPVANRPWNDMALPPDARARLVLREMTLDEKIALLHGEGLAVLRYMPPEIQRLQSESNGGSGFVLGVPRLGIPAIQISDAAYGVRFSAHNGRYSTALPSNLASAASWDPQTACDYGTLIGKELRAQGYNMSLGGGVNITRDPRNGRTFEYMGEDPVLAGTMIGARIRCEGAQHVLSEIKHFALNDQESGRQEVNVHIEERAAHESDLLAFELGIRYGRPNAVMCSYNGVNGIYACENPWLLTEVLRHEWGFHGFVISDWGGTHSTVAASAAGLDQEQSLDTYYGAALKQDVEAGKIPASELDEHVLHVLSAEFASGIVDDPVQRSVVDPLHGLEVARHVEEQSAVLLKNDKHVLPLSRKTLRSIAVIGLHANMGMISGGGSAQVDPPGAGPAPAKTPVWFPTSPLNALKKKAPNAVFRFSSGEDIADSVTQARRSEVAIVFAWQWSSEETDLSNLSLPDNQDRLIAAVAAVNPRTIVVLETGSAITMPWLPKTSAVLEAWYGGSSGADAIANLLFGDVNPSGKLPMTFPQCEAELPRARIAQPATPIVNGKLSFSVDYNIEGAAVGYKWYDWKRKPVLFPFGFGLSYTSFRYSDLHIAEDGSKATLTLTNTGKYRGAEAAEVYVTVPNAVGEPWKRLAGWQKVELKPGEKRKLTIALEPLAMSVWNSEVKKWERPSGTYRIEAGSSSDDLPLKATLTVN